MISLHDVDFRYGDGGFRLSVPRFDVETGEAVAVIGPSGSGKTTLLNLVAGIAVPRSGSVRVDDVEVNALSDGARRDHRITQMGLVFQEFELLEHLNVLDNVLLPYRITSALTLDRGVVGRAERLADEVGIGDKLRRYTRQMSHGEKQRVAICRALLPEPKLILTDEPTGNLDPQNKDRVIDILLAHARRADTTILTVTHDHGLLDRFDRVVDVERFHGGNGASEAVEGGAS